MTEYFKDKFECTGKKFAVIVRTGEFGEESTDILCLTDTKEDAKEIWKQIRASKRLFENCFSVEEYEDIMERYYSRLESFQRKGRSYYEKLPIADAVCKMFPEVSKKRLVSSIRTYEKENQWNNVEVREIEIWKAKNIDDSNTEEEV